MKVLVIGAGNMGSGFVKQLTAAEPLGGLNIYFGYGAGLGTSIAPSWIRKN